MLSDDMSPAREPVQQNTRHLKITVFETYAKLVTQFLLDFARRNDEGGYQLSPSFISI